jgi:hypothetical protein
MYSRYCLNKPNSDELWRDYCMNSSLFKQIQLSLGQKLPLDAYLLKPVQRISKYQLILKELYKCLSTLNSAASHHNSFTFSSSASSSLSDLARDDSNLNDNNNNNRPSESLISYETVVESGTSLVKHALDTMLDVNLNINDIMHASHIIGIDLNCCSINNLKDMGRLIKRDQLQMAKIKFKKTINLNSMGNLSQNVIFDF